MQSCARREPSRDDLPSIGQDAESDVVALPLPLKESCAEISSPLVGQLCVTNIEIDAHAQRRARAFAA